ncbi:hypothetical protein HYS47_00720 [Candidatus Woesearchaeota archaeon]|nr:hypothetical protein [Candidatus Woesearchaeota archaeon]
MKPIRSFDEFVQENIVKKQAVDKSRASFLIKESENSYNNLLDIMQKIPLSNTNANTFVKLCYDIVLELVRARMLLDGYHAAGPGAHEAEVSFMRVLNFTEKEVQFIDQMRFFRNGILYYGAIIDKEYAEKAVNVTRQVYSTLRQMIIKKEH